MRSNRKNEPRICPICERREHKTGKGICQFCWGTGIRDTELGREPCIHCVIMFPRAPAFCIHKKQFFSCETCIDEMKHILKSDKESHIITQEHAKFINRNMRRRIDA